jgi:methionine synthase II (cobalamin-independent)
MFGTLLGGLPRPPAAAARGDIETLVEAVVRAQEDVGLEPITDGRLRTPDLLDLASGLAGIGGTAAEGLTAASLPTWSARLTVATWQSTAALTDRAVKQALPGPYTLGRRTAAPGLDREALTLAFAGAIRSEVEALAAAGCPLVEIEEIDAPLIGADEAERRLFREAHFHLATGVTGTHLSLSIVGGSAHEAGASTILDPPYASLAVDLITGPDNWYLVVATPADRGIVAGVLSPEPESDDGPEVMLWAARYAAATNSRGAARVGLGTAGGLDRLDWPMAVAKLERLGDAARIAALPPGDALAQSIDPRAIDIRSAALGRRSPPPKRRRPKGPSPRPRKT